MDWRLIELNYGLVIFSHFFINWQWIGDEFALDWHKIGTDWCFIESGLTMDWHRIGDGSFLVEDWRLTGVDRPRRGANSSSAVTSSLSL